MAVSAEVTQLGRRVRWGGGGRGAQRGPDKPESKMDEFGIKMEAIHSQRRVPQEMLLTNDRLNQDGCDIPYVNRFLYLCSVKNSHSPIKKKIQNSEDVGQR